MALLAFWKTSRDDVLGLTIQQILSNAGDGRLLDSSRCSQELREFIHEVPDEYLSNYVAFCLDPGFPDSGLVLQDLVNEIGRRIEFEVEHGLYRGKRSAIGFDGIWRSRESGDLLVEVKTSDHMTISLDRIAEYRKRLIQENKMHEESSALIVVGREDTGALEAQIRGSRHAWDMRLISAESLIKLLKIKIQSEDAEITRQIRGLLRPHEFTKIDQIINVVFTAAEDAGHRANEEKIDPVAVSPAHVDDNIPGTRIQIHTDRDELDKKRQSIVTSIEKSHTISLTQYRRKLFLSPDKSVAACIALSKNYDRSGYSYWYGFRPDQLEFISKAGKGYLVLGCMDRDEAFAIPKEIVAANTKNLNESKLASGIQHWHIVLAVNPDGTLAWNLSKIGKRIELSQYRFAVK